jgi:uncharacterized membrane protein YqgA involved in biofilm formation
VVDVATVLVGATVRVALGQRLRQDTREVGAATGGLMLVGVALRLLRIEQVHVGDLLPRLVVAPLLTALVATLR